VVVFLALAFCAWQIVLRYNRDQGGRYEWSLSLGPEKQVETKKTPPPTNGDQKPLAQADTSGETTAPSRAAPPGSGGGPVSSSPGNDSGASLIELSGDWENPAESPTEDLPIFLTRPKKQVAYSGLTLTLDYQTQAERITRSARYYLVILGDHIGRHEMSIPAADFADRGHVRIARLPRAGTGEPLQIYIEVEKPSFGRSRVRSSNIVKTTVKTEDAPTNR
jgi:hypothetical protein